MNSNGKYIAPVSECAFGPHAALAKKPEMLMYNMYTPPSELFAALPADQIHHSDPAPTEKIPNCKGGGNPLTQIHYSDTFPVQAPK